MQKADKKFICIMVIAIVITILATFYIITHIRDNKGAIRPISSTLNTVKVKVMDALTEEQKMREDARKEALRLELEKKETKIRDNELEYIPLKYGNTNLVIDLLGKASGFEVLEIKWSIDLLFKEYNVEQNDEYNDINDRIAKTYRYIRNLINYLNENRAFDGPDGEEIYEVILFGIRETEKAYKYTIKTGIEAKDSTTILMAVQCIKATNGILFKFWKDQYEIWKEAIDKS